MYRIYGEIVPPLWRKFLGIECSQTHAKTIQKYLLFIVEKIKERKVIF